MVAKVLALNKHKVTSSNQSSSWFYNDYVPGINQITWLPVWYMPGHEQVAFHTFAQLVSSLVAVENDNTLFDLNVTSGDLMLNWNF